MNRSMLICLTLPLTVALAGCTDDGPGGDPDDDETGITTIAGGAPKNGGNDPEKFFNATNQDELLLALEGILGEVTDCTIDLTEPPSEPPAESQIPFVEFTYEGMMVPLVDDCANEDGWAWIELGLTLEFCGSYCDDFKNGGSFDGKYGCPPAN